MKNFYLLCYAFVVFKIFTEEKYKMASEEARNASDIQSISTVAYGQNVKAYNGLH